MSVITKKQILEKVKSGEIAFKPALDQFQIQEHAVDLRLGFTFMIPKMWHMTPQGRESLDITHFNKNNNGFFEVVELEQGQYFDLLPQEYILVSTFESIKIPDDLMAGKPILITIDPRINPRQTIANVKNAVNLQTLPFMY
jgi:dCTP deaminase